MNISFIKRRLVGPLLCCLFAIAAFLVFTTQTAQAQNANSRYTFQNGTTIIATGDGIAPDINGNRTRTFNRSGETYLAPAQGELRMRATITLLQRVAGQPGTGEQTYYNARLTVFTVLGNQTTYTIRVQDPSDVGPTNPGGGEEEEERETTDCPIPKTADFHWAMCPMFRMVNGFVNVIDAFIHEYLSTGNAIFQDNQSDYREAWSTFRNFAIGLLVIAGLVMLISEALSLSIVDAYTVRKVLPRLLVAIIGISISWEFTEFLITLFDDLGQAMGSIIYTSFNIPATGINIVEVVTAWLLSAGAVTSAALLLGGFGILSLLGTLAMAMLVGAIVLILRQAIIVAAVLLAPLAIAAYVLPNTSKFANFWWDTLFRMLMLYPIATGLIALCKVLGNITMSNPTEAGGGIGGVIALVSGMVFFFAGYALIPLAFRLTGGLVATLGGIANDRSRGGFDRLKNFRKGKVEGNMAAMSRGERFKGNRYLGTDRFNDFTKGMAAFKNTRYKTAFMRNRGVRNAAIAEHDEMLRQQHLKSEAGQGNMFNDDSLRAQAAGATEQEARRNMRTIFHMSDEQIEHANNEALANGGYSLARQRSAAVQAAATGTAYNDLGQMAQVIGLASRGNEGSLQAMVGAIRATGGGGRYDLVGMGHSTLAGLARESMGANGQIGAPDAEHIQSAHIEAARSNNASRLLTGKAVSTSQISNALATRIQSRQAIADDVTVNESVRAQARAEVAELSATVSNMRGAAPFATEVNLSAMNTNRQTVAAPQLNRQGFTPPAPIVQGNIGLENSNVETVVNVVREQAQQPAFIRQERNGETVTMPNPQYRPDDTRPYTRNSQGRDMSGLGALDPRRDEENR